MRVELLPAAHGDAILVEYGPARSPRRILVDGGPAPTYDALRKRLKLLPANDRRLELLVVTHIDADHIDGAIILLQEAEALGLDIGEVWFNGWPQLDRFGPAVYAPLQGEFLGGVVAMTPKLASRWNARFEGGPVMAPADALPAVDLPGGARLTLLSPTERELRRLRARWVSAIRDFSPGDAREAVRRLAERREYRPPASPAVFAVKTYGDDRSVANGSSIAFLLEHGGSAVLLAADAHAGVLAASLRRLAGERGLRRLRVDAVKLPHHGSMSNVSEELLASVESERWLVSTNGAIFGHPDPETVQLIATKQAASPRILCNYTAPSTERLKAPSLKAKTGPTWTTLYPDDAGGGIALTLGARADRPPARRPRKR